MSRLLLILLLGAALAACGGARQSGEAGNRNVVTADELSGMSELSAHDVLSRIRPEFLRSRGARSLRGAPAEEYPVVYMDHTRLGSIDALRSIRASTIREIRYLNGADATTRYGTGHGAGVILVTTR
jgi:hypothetical protein